MALLQTAINPYISIIGPVESAAQRMSLVGLFNKSAGIIAPLLLGALFLKDTQKITARLDAASELTTKNAILDELLQRIPPLISHYLFCL